MTENWRSERDLRQREIVSPERLAACRATVVGVGAIDRQVALQLAAMGVPRPELIDPEVPEVPGT
jgi:sulfur carrier protein ThiS adenylyltransferase